MLDPLPHRALPAPGEVAVWWWPLDLPAEATARLRGLLSDEESRRADRFLRPSDGTRFVVAHGRLRQLIGSYTGLAPAELHFEAPETGKPRLAPASVGHAPRLRFNLSHSGALAAVAIADGVEVGVDIEMMRPVEPDLASRHFAREELAEIDGLTGDAWLAGFYRCWTRKEAVLKASGHGLGVPLDSFAVTLSHENQARVLRAEGTLVGATAWPLLPFRIAPDCPGAVALVAGGPGRLTGVERLPE